MNRIKLFVGSSHPNLGHDILQALNVQAASQTRIRFSNDNLLFKVDESVRDCDVFVLQTASTPLDTHIVELFIMLDTLRSCGAASICAILPYFPYVRSDKKDRAGMGITARLMADLIQESGATHAILLDLHSPQEEAFFRIPTNTLSAAPLFLAYLRENDLDNAVLVAPDAGEVKDLLIYAEHLRLPLAVIDKRRFDDSERAAAWGMMGEVRGKTAILIDDEIATGTTIVSAAEFLKREGAAQIWVLATHAVFSANASRDLSQAPIERIVVTDSLPIVSENKPRQLQVLSLSALLAHAIWLHQQRKDIAFYL